MNLALKQWDKSIQNPNKYQQAIFNRIIKKGKDSSFGRDHNFESINNYDDFCKQVPLRTYDGFLPYIERIKAGEEDVLYPGSPSYFAKTSGTTSGVKYIPLYNEYIKIYAKAGKQMIYNYLRETQDFEVLAGKNLFLQGSPLLDNIGKIKVGRMSGISYHIMPKIIKRKQLPSYQTDIMQDWEAKVKQIVKESKTSDIQMIGGIPPWIMMYFDYLSASCQHKLIKDIYPKLKLYIHGGVNIEPYRKLLAAKIGKTIHTIDTYTAS